MTKLCGGILLVLLLAACGPIEPPTARVLDGQTIEVVTTVGMITDAVERVGGSRVHVQGLMGPGVDPHLYKASEGDLRRLERADVVFFGGLHLEAKMADVLERIDERGLQGISTAAEAGAGDVQQLAGFIADRRIPAIFVESSVSPRTIEAVREAVRSRGFDVRIGGSLYSDAMGNPGTPDGTYIGMVRHNIDAIVAGLRG